MEPTATYPIDPISRRIEYQSAYGTVKYFGPLKHLPPEKTNNQLWIGVEWDDVDRGKHNGTVENTIYFNTTQDKKNGSLLKIEKADFGIDIIDGLLMKYFREDPKQMKQQLLESLKHGPTSNHEEEKKKVESDEKKKENGEKSKERLPVLVEYDEAAYFETIKKHKKKVEFYGFDRIWKKINNLKEIKEISLQELKISTFSGPSILASLLPHLKELALEKNLIFNFDQILHIGTELQKLESLSLSQNRLQDPDVPLNKLTKIQVFTETASITQEIDPLKAFPSLKTLILIEMDLTWTVLNKVLGVFPLLEELVLCRNKLIDFSALTIDVEATLPNLTFLNLEECQISDFSGLSKFSNLQKLEKLTLSKNYLTHFGEFQGFKAVQILSVENNLLEDLLVLCELSQFTNLKILRIKNNPMISKHGNPYVKQRAVAENVNIHTINGSILKKYERKDCEIFYLRNTFQEFFIATNSKYYQYNFDDFLNNFCKKDHPSIPRLLKTYGNPFEMDPNAKKEEVPAVVQKNVMLNLKIIALFGPFLGKDPMKKKFPENTTIVNLKGFLAKFLSVPSDRMVVMYKGPHQGAEPMEILEDDLKSLAFYSVVDGGELVVDEKAAEKK